MKNKTFFSIIAFLNAAALFAQSENQVLGLNNSNNSPLMMFSGDEEKSPTDATTDPRSPASRDISPRGARATHNKASRRFGNGEFFF